MGQINRVLPSVGEFDVAAVYETDTPERGALSLYSGSAGIPISLEVSFPDPNQPEEEMDDLHAGGTASYLLTWTSSMTREEVIELIRQVGEGQVDSKYVSFMSSAGEGDSKEDQSPLGDSNKSSVLSEVLIAGFNNLSVHSSDVSLDWDAELDIEGFGPGFSFMTANNYELTEPYVVNLVERTITARHMGGVAASLENVSAIFERYREADPRDL